MLPSSIATTHHHTPGEPLRIVAEPPVPLPPGATGVTEMACRTGEHVFSVDPHDPLVPGFVLR